MKTVKQWFLGVVLLAMVVPLALILGPILAWQSFEDYDKNGH